MPQFNALSTDNHRFAEQGSNPSTPAAGFWRVYFKADGLYIMGDDGSARLVHPIAQETYVSAANIFPSLTAGCAALAQTETTTNDVNFRSLDFDQTTQEHAEFSLLMPIGWLGGTITFEVNWTASGGSAAQTVKWGLQARAYVDGDDLDQSWGTGVTVTDSLTATNKMQYTDTSAAITIAGTAASGNWLQCRIYRDISDTLAADAKLLGVRIYWNG